MSGRLIKNVLANLGRGGTAAIIALVLPPVLIRHMTPSAYAVWVLALQAAAYAGYLDFGLQTAVGRYIAYAQEKMDMQWRDAIFSTAFAGLMIAALLGLLVVAVVAVACPRIFPSVPLGLVAPLRIMILIVGASVALGLPASAWNGVFVGMQRYEIPAVTLGLGKLLAAIGLVICVFTGQTLLVMAVVAAAANLFSYILQFGIFRRMVPDIAFRPALITRPIVGELSGYCASLTVWSFGMLLVNGLDLVLVGRFDFVDVPPYAVSATLITFLAGLQNAIFGIIMPHSATLHAREDSVALGNLLVRATRLNMLMLMLVGMPLIVFAGPVIGIWIGHGFAQHGGAILAMLVAANIVRLSGAPFASVLIGTGQQRLVVLNPLCEAGSNLIASILLGLHYGAIGVAAGTLLGGLVGMAVHVFYNLPRTKQVIDCTKARFLGALLEIPFWCGLPAYIVLLAEMAWPSWANRLIIPALALSCVCSATLLGRELLSQRINRTKNLASEAFQA